MPISEIIAVASGIGTLLSALATFLTVAQISRQRRASYHPELMLETITITGLKNKSSGSMLLSDWREGSDGVDFEPPETSFRGIPVRNVGLGAATTVRITWDMPIEEAVENINSLAQRLQVPMVLHHRDGMVSLASDEFGKITSMWKINLRRR